MAEAILCGRNRDQQHWMEQGCFREMRIGQTTMLRLSGLREVLRWEVVGRPSAFYLHKPVWRGSDA